MTGKPRPLGNNVRWALEDAAHNVSQCRRLIAKAADLPMTPEMTNFLLQMAIKLAAAETTLLTIPTEAGKDSEER